MHKQKRIIYLFAFLLLSCTAEVRMSDPAGRTNTSTDAQVLTDTGTSASSLDASMNTADAGALIDSGLLPTVTVDALSDGSFVCSLSGTQQRPGVLYNHGGLGTAVGGDLRGTCEALAEAGFVARSQKRRETTTLQGHLDDLNTGLDALLARSDVDNTRIGILGFSRGGLLAFQASLTRPSEIHAAVLMAPASGRGALERTLQDVSALSAPVQIHVSENDSQMDDHVGLARQVEGALNTANKSVDFILHPPFENDGHRLFFEVRSEYWNDLIAFLNQNL